MSSFEFGLIMAACLVAIPGVVYLLERIRLAREPKCGYRDMLGIDECRCGDPANHEWESELD